MSYEIKVTTLQTWSSFLKLTIRPFPQLPPHQISHLNPSVYCKAKTLKLTESIDTQYINMQGSIVWILIVKTFHFLRSSDTEICKNHDIFLCYPHDSPRRWSVIKLLIKGYTVQKLLVHLEHGLRHINRIHSISFLYALFNISICYTI